MTAPVITDCHFHLFGPAGRYPTQKAALYVPDDTTPEMAKALFRDLGVTRAVVLNVAPFSKESRDPWGNTRRGTTATATINRKDFGIDWNKSLDTGGLMIGDQVEITLEIEMILAKAG